MSRAKLQIINYIFQIINFKYCDVSLSFNWSSFVKLFQILDNVMSVNRDVYSAFI